MKILLPVYLLMISFSSILHAQQTAEEWYAQGVADNAQTRKIEHFSQAIQLNPDYAEAYNARANVHFVLGKAQEAIQDFSQSIRIDPTRTFTYYSRASCQLALGNYKAAVNDFEQVIHLQPDNVYAMSGKGCALLLQGKPEEAVAVLEETLAMDASVQSAFRCRNLALKKLGRPMITNVLANKTVSLANPSVSKQQESTTAEVEASNQFILKEATGMRESATHTSRVLLRFEAGNQVKLLEKTDEFWWKVRYNNKVGYVKAATLAVVN